MVQLRSLTLFVIFSVIVLISGQPGPLPLQYCRLCFGHTMCVFRNPNPVCPTLQVGLTASQRNEVLTVHNNFRRQVASGGERRGNPGPQPRARHMPNMVWDEELAIIAQRWANQCRFGHDMCRTVPRFQVGQNVGSLRLVGTIPPNMITRLIQIWYNEVVLFDSRQVESVRNFNFVKHYTQILWSTSVNIGCGYITNQQGNIITVTLVCNYGPAGNIVNGKMYDIRRSL
ncbi:venom allergen 5-like [Leptopilina heterotoma]|uniref:venom allergen 5-like n=1 Tax=Leptopilina heterotoma TaxID=63436 RepID=UPI001CAA0126|nr:venom allergen 5-like [Leptopilina heterotoma]